MKFKLDENLPVEIGEDFRELGYDADTVLGEGLRGEEDPVIIESARTSNRILLTLDKGIANILRRPPSKRAGVVLFRARLPDVLKMDLGGHLTVVGPTRIRTRQACGSGILANVTFCYAEGL